VNASEKKYARRYFRAVIFAMLLVMIGGCAFRSHPRLAFYKVQAERGKVMAIKLVAEHIASEQHKVSILDLEATPNLDWATKDIPMFCPGEYVVTVSGYWKNHLQAPRWKVDISTGKVRRLTPLAEVITATAMLEPSPGSDADRIDLCMDGKTPVDLDPATLPKEPDV